MLWAHRRKVSRQAGFALILVTVTMAVLGAVVGEFSYNARVEMEAAANARDEMRAEYLARSGINLSRLLIKVQQVTLDRFRQFVGDLQLADFAPYLVKAFGGPEDERAGLGGLLGIDASQIQGLGVGKNSSFDVDLSSEDGKINLNCGGGLNPTFNAANINMNANGTMAAQQQPQPGTAMPIQNPAQAEYQLLTALFFSPRYNRLFDTPDADGQYTTRDEVARAILDWTDVDQQRFEPMGPGQNPEDYHYDTLRDPYRPHDNYYDTTDEAQLVKGVGDDFWGSFGQMFTVYGRCKVNLNAIKPDHWPISAAVIRVAAKNPQDPVLLDDTLVAGLAQQIGTLSSMLGGMNDISQFAQYAGNAGMPQNTTTGTNQNSQQQQQMQQSMIPGLQGIQLDSGRLSQIATVGPRQVYRIESTGSIARTESNKRIQVRIKAIWDTQHFNQNTTSIDPNDRQGTWVYWRME